MLEITKEIKRRKTNARDKSKIVTVFGLRDYRINVPSSHHLISLQTNRKSNFGICEFVAPSVCIHFRLALLFATRCPVYRNRLSVLAVQAKQKQLNLRRVANNSKFFFIIKVYLFFFLFYTTQVSSFFNSSIECKLNTRALATTTLVVRGRVTRRFVVARKMCSGCM